MLEEMPNELEHDSGGANPYFRLSRVLLLAPGLFMIVISICSDFLVWNRQVTWYFGAFEGGIAIAGGMTVVVGLLMSRLLPAEMICTASKTIFGCCVLGTSLFALDLVLRVSDPLGLKYYRDVRQYFSQMVPDVDFYYKHTPGWEGILQDVKVAINSSGLRWRETPIEKPEGELRLMILGDSFVFGWGVDEASIFPSLLETMIRRTNPNWQVISAGVGSWNTRAECEWFRKEGAAYEPDVVLLIIVTNDVNSKDAQQTPREGWKPIASRVWSRVVERSYVCGYVQHICRIRYTHDREELYADGSPQWQDARSALYEIASMCRRNDIRLVAWLQHVDKPNHPFARRYESCLRELNVPVMHFPSISRKHQNSIVDGHPNAEGHRIMAEHIWPLLKPFLTDSQRDKPPIEKS